MLVVAIASLLYAIVSLHRLVYLLTFSIVVVTLHQLIAPVEDDSSEVPKENQYTEKVKVKWD